MYYQKDTILLLEGLLETNGVNYFQIKSQLDTQYRLFLNEKVIEINKLFNFNDKSLNNESQIKELLYNYKMKNQKLFKKLLLDNKI